MNSTEKAEMQEDELIPVETPEDADDHDENHDAEGQDDERLSDSRTEEEDERRESRRNERKRRDERAPAAEYASGQRQQKTRRLGTATQR